MKTLIYLCIILLFASMALAETIYDPSTGNTYNVYRDSSGTHIYGNNPRTGTMWNNNIDKYGNESGRDSHGNYYNYDHNTGNYHNYGTGTNCYGKGAYRRCY